MMREVLFTTVKTMETLGVEIPVKEIVGSYGIGDKEKKDE